MSGWAGVLGRTTASGTVGLGSPPLAVLAIDGPAPPALTTSSASV